MTESVERPVVAVVSVSADNDSALSSLSSDDDLDIAPRNDGKPRSIFDNYWKNGTPKASKPSVQIQRPTSPVGVMVDPYEHFGLLEEETSVDKPVNCYEHSLQQCENAFRQKKQSQCRRPYESTPLWMSWFTQSEPDYYNEAAVPGLRRQVKSDTLIRPRPKSVLRRGRFGGGRARSGNVKFEPTIQVYCYELPMEKYASEGWSSLFGI